MLLFFKLNISGASFKIENGAQIQSVHDCSLGRRTTVCNIDSKAGQFQSAQTKYTTSWNFQILQLTLLQILDFKRRVDCRTSLLYPWGRKLKLYIQKYPFFISWGVTFSKGWIKTTVYLYIYLSNLAI